MLDLDPSPEQLLSTYGLSTPRPKDRKDVRNIDQSYPENLSGLSIEESFQLMKSILALDDPDANECEPTKGHELEDPLKGRGSNIVVDLMKRGIISSPEDPSVKDYLISSQTFKPYKYLTTIHKDTPLKVLDESLHFLDKSIQSYTRDLQASLDSNITNALNVKVEMDGTLQGFKQSKTKSQEDKEVSKYFNPQRHRSKASDGVGSGDISSELESSLNNLATTNTLMIRPIIENKAKEDTLNVILDFIKSNSFLFDIPRKLINSLAANDSHQFIDDYTRYDREKMHVLKRINSSFQSDVDKLKQSNDGVQDEAALNSLNKIRLSKLTIIAKVFQEIEVIASQFRDKTYQELSSLDHEASKNQSSISGAGSRNKDDQKFMSLVENLSKIESARGQNNQSDPIGVFLNKQIEVLVSDFEYQEKKFDSKFALMQKKLIDYVASLRAERRQGSHLSYISEKYETYKNEIKLAKNKEEKMLAIDEAFESGDALDISLVNETWLVLVNFMSYMETIFIKLVGKFANNYSSYYKLNVDPSGLIRGQFFQAINEAVDLLVRLFQSETNSNDNKEVNNLESMPANYRQFVPCYSNSLSTIHQLSIIQTKVNRVLTKLGIAVTTIGNVSKFEDTNKQLKALKSASSHINQKILEAVCSTWINDCSQFYDLEDWKIEDRYNAKDGSCTKLINVIEYYQLYMISKIGGIILSKEKESQDELQVNIVASYPSKRVLMSIEIQFMRTLNIIVDSLMKKYNIDRSSPSKKKGTSIEVFKILTVNNLDKLSRTTYPLLIFQFDQRFGKDLSKQKLKLFADIDKASLTILDDILANEKEVISSVTSGFFSRISESQNEANFEVNFLSIDGFVFEVLMHFVKLVHKLKPLTSGDIFITIINELQYSFLKSIKDGLGSVNIRNVFILYNLKLDCNFLHSVFETSKGLRLNDSTFSLLQNLLENISTQITECDTPRGNDQYSDTIFKERLKTYLKSSKAQFECF
ncbi:Sec5 protein [Candida orthopsilosis Co 90-125]|uniref:Exocyst complex component SEC5 n=1 Tax=Candida orthopsilosis (strain 90-125) TaxID=1136231 RepID=H8X5I9_CANO9|nr:Sec5 protein [Candida orthopsilosis Co 90-125]CCG23446.1 Sec5 protein [Candida orthopsilosis Co 90-125]